MKRWKYHPESGAYEFYQTEDEKMLLKASKTTEQLTVENNQLKNNMNNLLKFLTQKNIMTIEEANQFMPEGTSIDEIEKPTVIKKNE